MAKNHNQTEKLEMLSRIFSSADVRAACRNEGIGSATYYRWLKSFKFQNKKGLVPKSKKPKNSPNKTSNEIVKKIIKIAKSKKYRFATHIKLHLEQDNVFLSVNVIIKILREHNCYNRTLIVKPNTKPYITRIHCLDKD